VRVSGNPNATVDDAEFEEMFAAADTNGDGKLSVEKAVDFGVEILEKNPLIKLAIQPGKYFYNLFRPKKKTPVKVIATPLEKPFTKASVE
jgi:hypothetical protein